MDSKPDSKKKNDLEYVYEQLFQTETKPTEPQRESLAQPTPLKVVETVTTYGAYEEPI